MSALGIVSINQCVIFLCEWLNTRQKEAGDIRFLFKVHALRVVVLVAMGSGVLVFCDIHPLRFTLFFIFFYMITLYMNLVKYGTK